MRSRAAADANAAADIVVNGRDVVVRGGHGNVVVQAAADTTTAAAATTVVITGAADNATTTFRRRPVLLPPPNQTEPADGGIPHQPQSLGTVMVLMVVTVVVLGTVGLLTCVLHHYNQQYNPAVPSCLTAASGPHHCRLSTPPPPPSSPSLPSPEKKTTVVSSTATVVASLSPPPPPPPPPPLRTTTTTTTIGIGCCGGQPSSASSPTAMLTMRSNNGLSREHDRQVRLHSVRTDLELDLPPRIHLPDGEEYPYGSMAKLHLRNSEQEQEIYQKCIRGPPNRTIWPSAAECGKLSQPHRSNSATGLSTSLSTFSSEVDSVTRCNSVSSRYVCLPRTGFPPVDNIQSLSSLTMVPCLSHVDKQTMSQ